jgi:manganese efflux pump family protein
MDVAALVLWAVTAAGGALMTAIWLAGRGPAQHRAGIARISPARLGGHAALAVVGLVLWVVHVSTGSGVAGWLALALLPVVAAIGLLMFMTWLGGRGAARPGDAAAEQRFPFVVVVAHGAFAVLTLLAVVVALVG